MEMAANEIINLHRQLNEIKKYINNNVVPINSSERRTRSSKIWMKGVSMETHQP